MEGMIAVMDARADVMALVLITLDSLIATMTVTRLCILILINARVAHHHRLPRHQRRTHIVARALATPTTPISLVTFAPRTITGLVSYVDVFATRRSW